jgi:hypothetical protein
MQMVPRSASGGDDERQRRHLPAIYVRRMAPPVNSNDSCLISGRPCCIHKKLRPCTVCNVPLVRVAPVAYIHILASMGFAFANGERRWSTSAVTGIPIDELPELTRRLCRFQETCPADKTEHIKMRDRWGFQFCHNCKKQIINALVRGPSLTPEKM